MTKKFEGKVVVVTGASSGIGRQAAIDFAKHGARAVVLAARSQAELENLADSITKDNCCQALPYPCDVSDKNQIIKMGGAVLERFGAVDVLVNNAGFAHFGPVQKQSIEEIESIMATNYLGMVYCTKVFLDSMLARKAGHIVNVASVAASFGVAGLAAYCGSKFAILGFSEALHHELHGTGVSVTVVSPIGVKTNFFGNKSFQGHVPNYTGFMLDAKTVSRAVIAAASSPRLEIIVPFYVRAGVWLKHTLPYVVNPIVGSAFRQKLEK